MYRHCCQYSDTVTAHPATKVDAVHLQLILVPMPRSPKKKKFIFTNWTWFLYRFWSKNGPKTGQHSFLVSFFKKLKSSKNLLITFEIIHQYGVILDICGASKTSESLCKNNMIILKLLSEEVFEFSTDQMTKAKIQHLKKSMSSEFSNVFELCMFVLVSNHWLFTFTITTIVIK